MTAPLIDQGVEHIRGMISSGALQPGSRLPPEAQLAELLGCSRNTTREVVKALSMANVVDVRRGDGTYITSLAPKLLLEGIGFAVDLMREKNLLDLWEVRRLLEPPAAAKAAERIGDDQLAELEKILDQMRHSPDDAAIITADAHFHEVVVQSAGNETLASILANLSSRTFRSRV